MCAPRASASTSSGCAYSRSIRSRTRRSRARSRRCWAAAGVLVTWTIVPCGTQCAHPIAADDLDNVVDIYLGGSDSGQWDRAGVMRSNRVRAVAVGAVVGLLVAVPLPALAQPPAQPA